MDSSVSTFSSNERKSCLKIDLFTKIDEFERIQLGRATRVRLPGIDSAVSVATAEDTILSKLVWFRKGNEVSERQWRDILGVITVSREMLDEAYMHQWADKLGVTELLDRAFKS